MTSKEALEELEAVLKSNPGTVRYADIFIENLLRPIAKDLEVLDIFKRLVTSEEVWKDVEFGTDQQRLYIDGDIYYKDEKEKKLFLNWLKEWLEND